MGMLAALAVLEGAMTLRPLAHRAAEAIAVNSQPHIDVLVVILAAAGLAAFLSEAWRTLQGGLISHALYALAIGLWAAHASRRAGEYSELAVGIGDALVLAVYGLMPLSLLLLPIIRLARSMR